MMLKILTLFISTTLVIIQSVSFGLFTFITLNDECTGTSTGCNQNTLACDSSFTYLEVFILILVLIIFITLIILAYRFVKSKWSMILMITLAVLNLLLNLLLCALSPQLVKFLLNIPTGALSC